ncbi:MAG: acetate--CoA ligase family protein [Candidatus Thermoplasmatota archaeon]|nr:acetate--CoA ligase family protein [Candidatus Thermoplasmatota archaeon]
MISDSGIISEYEAKQLLASKGITVPEGIVVDCLPQTLSLQFPVVLKVSSSTILHKSDAGGVRLNIRNMDELREEFSVMQTKFPHSSFLIESMAGRGAEFIIGVTIDPVFGHTIMIGSGGIYTELYSDVTFRKIPIDKTDAADMISSIKSKVFCQGFRGMRIDCRTLEKLLVRLSDIVMELGTIETMDLNPVIVDREKATVVDAKIKLKLR